jgi:lipopolysaccharide transport system ATP-binding protein
MNGTILGMKKREIDRKFDEIVEFSGIERFLETPIKRYSSGMKVRLAFSVAAYLDPKVLIVDEVLAVGDAEFQRKCLGKMNEVANRGRTVIFVSHNLSAVQALCGRAIVLEGGATTFDGDTSDAIPRYLRPYTTSSSRYIASGDHELERLTYLLAVTLHRPDGQDIDSIESGDPLEIRFSYRTKERSQLECAVGLYNNFGQKLFHFASRASSYQNNDTRRCITSVPAGDGSVICDIPSLPLTPGRYFLNIHMACDGQEIAYVQGALTLEVTEPLDPSYGWVSAARTSAYVLGHEWRCLPCNGG